MRRVLNAAVLVVALAGCTAEQRRAFVDAVPEGTAPRISKDVATGDYTDAIVAGVTALVLGVGGLITYKVKKRKA